MTQQEKVIQNLINFLDKGVVYIYRPKDEKDTIAWLQVNTKHMEMLLHKYNDSLITCGLHNVSVQIIINGQLRQETTAKDIGATIQYFRGNVEEFTNYEEKVVRFKYVFKAGAHRVTQEELIERTQEYDICYRYAPMKENEDKNTNWIKKNMNFLSDRLASNHKTLKECRYGITVKINGDTRYASSAEDYESIVSYFRDSAEEYSNYVSKHVLIKYIVF